MNWVCKKCYAALQAADYKDREILTLGNLCAPCVYCGAIDKAAYCLRHAPMPPPFEVSKAETEKRDGFVLKAQQGNGDTVRVGRFIYHQPSGAFLLMD